MTTQAPTSIFMVRPAAFGFNTQTANSNAFQINEVDDPQWVNQTALHEFDRMTDLLRAHDIDVHVLDDTPIPVKPDAVFPNNWISFHEDGRVILYPMLADNRRLERRATIIETLAKEFEIIEVTDWSGEEQGDRFLEGTGSVVFDYVNKIAFANRSPRTDENLAIKLCKLLGYKPIIFDAVDADGKPIYHTNVLMCIGSKFAVICLDAIHKDDDQEKILVAFAETGHKVIAISYAQMNAFAGNMIEVSGKNGEPFVVLSGQAFNSLLPGQVDAISRHAEMIPVSIPVIEKVGGGSVRCMMAGIFNVKR
ncbi:MAG: amidinotransferase [Cyclobacteriaceae bacterium]|nr:amidinotransferase [Cyclobacteriaceae bacterium]